MNKYEIEFYHTVPKGQRLPIEQSTVDREWMNKLYESYAYRCLPMTYASRHGWCVRLVEDVNVVWHGGHHKNSTEIICGAIQNGVSMVGNGTGNGVVTFHLNAIPRTTPEWNLWIMGAPNLVIPGASPLSGIVESDWVYISPTMNWKITQPEKLITFKAGDPVIFFIPIHKTELEEFKLVHKSIDDDPEMRRHYIEHRDFRRELDSKNGSSFTRDYIRGVRYDKTKPEWPHNHKTKLTLDTPDTNA